MQLQIFGLLQPGSQAAILPKSLIPSKPDALACPPALPAAAIFTAKSPSHDFFGNVCRVDGNQLQVALRSGHSVIVDMVGAGDHRQPLFLTPGRTVQVEATIDNKGVAHASRVSRAHMLSPITPADR
jgi:hypothetical protein